MKWWTEECTVGVNWKSRNAAHPHSSNVFPKEGDFLDNKFSASDIGTWFRDVNPYIAENGIETSVEHEVGLTIGALDAWVVYSSGPSEFYYEGDDLSLLHSHGVDNLNNYLTPRAMLSSRVDGTRKLQRQGDCSILQKLSARSFHIYVINLHPKLW
uniref:Uncharacterized protein n=1 Tax=Solanum lycopersicum TaxID=4081 RepID=A0A3Q7FAY9_SOLLC